VRQVLQNGEAETRARPAGSTAAIASLPFGSRIFLWQEKHFRFILGRTSGKPAVSALPDAAALNQDY
jgi:hypothetical protein